MSADFPAFAVFGPPKRKPYIHLSENKQETIDLDDGRKIHLLIENLATKNPEPEPVPLTEDQISERYVLAFAFLFVVLAICMVCTFFATI